jgi:deoxyribodipyrimidine photo-lyase
VVDEKAALQAARERLYGLRATPQARAEADAVQARHGSRKSGLPPARRPGAQTAGRAAMPPRVMPSPQGDLFA